MSSNNWTKRFGRGALLLQQPGGAGGFEGAGIVKLVIVLAAG